jgi:hypothetical protein
MKWNWGTGLAVTYIAFASATIGFVVFAMNRPVSLVRPDYYAESLREDQQIAARANARQLGATVSIASEGPDVIRLSIPADQAATARGSIVLYRASDPAADRAFAFTPDAQGSQQIRLNALASGHWIVKLHWTAAGRDYDTEQPVMLR